MENSRIVTGAGAVVAGLTFALFVYAQARTLPATMRAQVTGQCVQPVPAKVKLLAGGEVRRGIRRGPGAETRVREVIEKEMAVLAQNKANKYQRREPPYENETPFVCPDPVHCQIIVKGTFVTEPAVIPVTFDEATGISTGVASLDLIAEASCVQK